MVAPNCKDSLLCAAEALAADEGAAHVTLDAVAKRAGISKGGLLYHYPTKEALLSAMIERVFNRFDNAREEALKALPPGPGHDMQAEIISQFKAHDANQHIGSTILAVTANQPELMDSFRQKFLTRFKDLVGEGENSLQLAILLYATYGICLMELLKLSPIDEQQRQAIVEEMLRQASKS